MRKLFVIALMIIALFSMSATSLAQEDTTSILIAYFSMPETNQTDGVDASSGASIVVHDGMVMGNMEYVAQMIEQSTEGDLFRIETVEPYPLDHSALIDQASEERAAGARPALATQIENLDAYDIIFLGYPNWWSDMPMPLYSFLEAHDLSGKTIIPFNTHGGSGFSGTIGTITELEPDATVVQDGFTVSRDGVIASTQDISAWLQGLGY